MDRPQRLLDTLALFGKNSFLLPHEKCNTITYILATL
jgi:hypothetical protein